MQIQVCFWKRLYVVGAISLCERVAMLSATEKAILAKMLRHGYIGGKHTSEDNIPKGLPKHMHGEVKKALKKLIKAGYVIPKITSYGMEVALDPHRIDEIHDLLH
jgi:hypothetical protein